MKPLSFIMKPKLGETERRRTNMISCTCIVQEGQTPDQNKGGLQAVLNGFTDAAFGENAQIAWIPVGQGNGFTEGKPSTSSVVSMTANKPLEADQRETLLRELVGLWTQETGCTVDEVVAVIADPQKKQD